VREFFVATTVRALFALLVLVALSLPAAAHDIPGEMRVHAFVKPEGERLNLLIRVPLALTLNLDLPKRGSGYIELAHVDAALSRAVAAIDRDLELFEDGRRLQLARGSGRISEPSERSFETYDSARALVHGPKLAATTDVFWNQGYFDAHLEYPITSAHASIALDFRVSPGLRDRLKLDLRYISPDGVTRAFEVPTDSGLLVLDPRWYQAAWTFVKSGFAHILAGTDHLLFLLCLIVPFRRFDWYLVGVITAFTIAHSITLIAAAYGLVPSGAWFPALVEMLIAASILYTVVENVIRPNLAQRWLVASAFGLIHGFGFSFILATQLQFAGAHLALSLFAFNVGIELGQLAALSVVIPVLGLLYRYASERVVIVIVSVLVGHTAWHWMTERADALWKTEWPIPGSIAAIVALILVLVMGATILAYLGLANRKTFEMKRRL
jgi:HupE / UreJ protein